MIVWIVGFAVASRTPAPEMMPSAPPHNRPGAAELIVRAKILTRGVQHNGPWRPDYEAPQDLVERFQGAPVKTDSGHTPIEVISGSGVQEGDVLAVLRRSDYEWTASSSDEGREGLFFLRSAWVSSHTRLPAYQYSVPGETVVYLPLETPEDDRCASIAASHHPYAVIVPVFDPETHTRPEWLGMPPGSLIYDRLPPATVCDAVSWPDFLDAIRKDADIHAARPAAATEAAP